MDQDRYQASGVNELLSERGIKLSKALGQNFLVDPNIPEKIVRMAGFGESCGVLEVGPGLGALTVALSSAAKRVTAVEIDERLLPLLRERLIGLENVEIIQGNILKLNVEQLVKENMPGLTYHVCANLPYNITTPVLTSLINTGIFETITVMLQREVARRICAKPGSPEYGAFSVYVTYHTAPVILFDVSPECFVPRPAVYSSVIRLSRREERILSPADEPVFFKVVRAAFGQRRKTLVNALHAVFGNSMSKDEIAGIVRKSGYDTRVRGETLSVEEFAALSAFFRK